MADNVFNTEDLTKSILEHIDLKKLAASAEESDLAKELQDAGTNVEGLSDILEKLTVVLKKDFEKELKTLNEQLKKDSSSRKGRSKNDKKFDLLLDYVKGLHQGIDRMAKGDKNVSEILSKLGNDFERVARGDINATNIGSGGGGGGGVGSGGGIGSPGGGGRRRKNSAISTGIEYDKSALISAAKDQGEQYKKALFGTISHGANSVAAMLLGGTDIYSELVKGLPDAALLYRREMNKVLYLTEGLNTKTVDLRESYKDLNKFVNETGYDLATSTKSMVMLASRGIKGASAMKSIAKSSLFTAHSMGLGANEAEQITNLFADWNQHLGLGKHQLSAIGASMATVAAKTGLTGQNLLNAVRSSGDFLDRMRKAGTLTATSAENAITLSAALQKRGVLGEAGDLIGNLLDATGTLTGKGGLQTVLGASAARAGGPEMFKKYLSGTLIKSNKDMMQWGTNLISVIEKQFNISMKDLESIEPMKRARIEAILKENGIQSLDTINRLVGGLQESSEPLETTLDKWNNQLKENSKKLAAGNISEALRKKLTEENAKLTMQTDQRKMAFAQKLNSMAQDVLENGKGYKSDDLANNKESLSKAMQEMNQKGLAEQVMKGDKDSITKAIGLYNAKFLKEQGGPDFEKKMLKLKGPELLVAMEDMAANLREVSVGKLKENTSPIDTLQHEVNKLNGILLNEIGPPLEKIGNALGAVGLGAIYAALLAIGAFAAVKSGGNLSKLLLGFDAKNLLGRMFPEKGISSIGASFNGMLGGVRKKIEGVRDVVWGTKSVTVPMDKVRMGPMGPLGPTHKVIPGKKGLIGGLEDFLTKPRSFKKISAGIIEGVSNAIGAVTYNMPKKAIEGMASFFGRIDFTRMFAGLKTNLIIGFFEVIEYGKKALNLGFKGLREVWNLKNLFGWGGIKGLTKSWSGLAGLAKGISKGAGAGYKAAKAAIVGSTLGTATIVFGVIDGIIGAFDGFSTAGETFKKVLEDSNQELSTSMKISATVGGAIWGIIDGLLLGIPGLILGFFGLEDTVKKFVTFIVHSFTVFFEGIWDGIKEAIEWFNFGEIFGQIKEQFAEIGTVIVGIWNSISAALGGPEVKGMEDIFIGLWKIIKPIGKFIGWIVGGAIGSVFWSLLKVFQGLLWVIKWIVKAIGGLIDLIIGGVKLLWHWIKLVATPLVAVGLFFKSIFDLFSGKNTFGDIIPTLVKYVDEATFGIATYFYNTMISTMDKAWAWFMNMVYNNSGGLFGKKAPETVEQKVANAVKGVDEVAKKNNIPLQGLSDKAKEDKIKELQVQMSEKLKTTGKYSFWESGPIGSLMNLFGSERTLSQPERAANLDEAAKINNLIKTLRLQPGETLEGQMKGTTSPKVFHENMKDLKKSSEDLTKKATEKGSIYTHDIHIEKLLNSMMGRNNDELNILKDTPLIGESLKVANAQKDKTSVASPVLFDDDYESDIQKEKASTEGKSKGSLKEISQMVNINEEQLRYLAMMYEGQQEMIALLQPTSGSSSKSTKANTKPRNSPDYHGWQFGRFAYNANFGVVTDGN